MRSSDIPSLAPCASRKRTRIRSEGCDARWYQAADPLLDRRLVSRNNAPAFHYARNSDHLDAVDEAGQIGFRALSMLECHPAIRVIDKTVPDKQTPRFDKKTGFKRQCAATGRRSYRTHALIRLLCYEMSYGMRIAPNCHVALRSKLDSVLTPRYLFILLEQPDATAGRGVTPDRHEQ